MTKGEEGGFAKNKCKQKRLFSPSICGSSGKEKKGVRSKVAGLGRNGEKSPSAFFHPLHIREDNGGLGGYQYDERERCPSSAGNAVSNARSLPYMSVLGERTRNLLMTALQQRCRGSDARTAPWSTAALAVRPRSMRRAARTRRCCPFPTA